MSFTVTGLTFLPAVLRLNAARADTGRLGTVVAE